MAVTAGNSGLVRFWATVVAGVAAGVGLMATVSGPHMVSGDVKRPSDWLGGYTYCGPERAVAFPTSVVRNSEKHTVDIVSITPGAGSTNVRVVDFAAIDVGTDPDRLPREAVVGVGSPTLPHVRNPHRIAAGHWAVIGVKVAIDGRPADIRGFDITYRNGETHVLREGTRARIDPVCTR